jgi:hypothetical protein
VGAPSRPVPQSPRQAPPVRPGLLKVEEVRPLPPSFCVQAVYYRGWEGACRCRGWRGRATLKTAVPFTASTPAWGWGLLERHADSPTGTTSCSRESRVSSPSYRAQGLGYPQTSFVKMQPLKCRRQRGREETL